MASGVFMRWEGKRRLPCTRPGFGCDEFLYRVYDGVSAGAAALQDPSNRRQRQRSSWTS